MEAKARPTNLCSRIYKESSTVNWRIKGFNLMPFIEDHPVCGPWFMLGDNRNSTWSMVVTKQVHGGVENIGFKLMRADDDKMWDMVTFSLGLKTDDGWFVSCIENQVVGKESNNPYVFLVRPSKSGVVGVPMFGDTEVTVLEYVNAGGNVLNLLNKPVGDSNTVDESSGVKESATVDSSEGSPKDKGATLVESGYSSEGSPGAKTSTTAQTDGVLKANVEDNKRDTLSLTPEELFQQKNITVECNIEYTYMTCDPIPDKDEPDHPDLTEACFDLFTSGKYSDITIKCEGVSIPCHKAVLCTRSKLFQEFVDKEETSGLKPNQEEKASSEVVKPNQEKDASSDLVIKPNQEKEASSDVVVKANQEKEATSDAVSKPNQEKEVTSDAVSKPNQEKEESSDLVIKPNQEKEASSDVVVKANQEKEATSDTVSKPNQEKEATSDTVSKPNQEKEASSDAVSKPNQEKEASSDALPKPNHEKESSSYAVPKPNQEKEASSELMLKHNLGKKQSSVLVLKLNLDLTTTEALLHYMYTDDIDDMIKTKDECVRLHRASVQFGLPGLKKLCLDFLEDIFEEEVSAIENESVAKLMDEKSSLISICLEDDKASVGEEVPVSSNIATQTLTTN